MRKPPTSKKRAKGGKNSSQAVSELQRQAEIRRAFEAAQEKLFVEGPCDGLVFEIAILQGMLCGEFRDIPKETHEQLGGTLSERTKKLLFDPLRKGDAQHFFGLAKAIAELNKLTEQPPWELAICKAFDFLLEQFEKTGGPFPWDQDLLKKLAKHLRALSIAFPENQGKVRDYTFVKISEMPPTDRELVKKAMRTVREPRWDRVLPRCGLALLQAKKGGRPPGSKNLLQ